MRIRIRLTGTATSTISLVTACTVSGQRTVRGKKERSFSTWLASTLWNEDGCFFFVPTRRHITKRTRKQRPALTHQIGADLRTSATISTRIGKTGVNHCFFVFVFFFWFTTTIEMKGKK